MKGAAARARLVGRLEALPQLAARASLAPFSLAGEGERFRRVVSAGLGSSEGHARFLAALLSRELGQPAELLRAGAFHEAPPPGSEEDALVVFSQGLPPNARGLVANAGAWRAALLVTSVEGASLAHRERVAGCERAGMRVLDGGAGHEYDGLMRVTGALAGYLAALRVAAGFGLPLEVTAAQLGAALGDALAAARAQADDVTGALCTEELCLVASGGAADAASNLRLKLVEGLQRSVPPVCDPLEFAHGPFQRLHGRRALLLLCGPEPSDTEAEALRRVRALLEPGRQRLVRIPAALPGWWALLEQEVALGAWVLAAMERADLDPAAWPGRGADSVLYDWTPPPPTRSARGGGGARAPVAAALAELTWPELEARLAGGARCAVLPLGSTEQHGPHLPFATDTWIADALAARFCARVPEAVALPALPVGCASEHLGFPGTLHLEPDTLAALLGDLLRSLSRHGFETVFCFSAHGGNLALLRERQAALAAAAAPARLVLVADAAPVDAALRARAAAAGIAPATAGMHAGELESSIVAGLRPGALRRDRLAPGLAVEPGDGAAVFDGDLRARAERGVVGDPRQASATRAEGYLAAWVEVLVAAYRAGVASGPAAAGDAKRQAAKGTKSP